MSESSFVPPQVPDEFRVIRPGEDEPGNDIMNPQGRDVFRAQEEYADIVLPGDDTEARRAAALDAAAVIPAETITEFLANAEAVARWLADGTMPDSPPDEA